jgi:hypothetical protein
VSSPRPFFAEARFVVVDGARPLLLGSLFASSCFFVHGRRFVVVEAEFPSFAPRVFFVAGVLVRGVFRPSRDEPPASDAARFVVVAPLAPPLALLFLRPPKGRHRLLLPLVGEPFRFVGVVEPPLSVLPPVALPAALPPAALRLLLPPNRRRLPVAPRAFLPPLALPLPSASVAPEEPPRPAAFLRRRLSRGRVRAFLALPVPVAPAPAALAAPRERPRIT